MMQRIFNRPFFIKLLHWEYWSFTAVYAPIYVVWALICLRTRSFFFINASNPSIKNGGFLLESKKEIYDIIPSQYYPPTLFFIAGTESETVINKVREADIAFPLIAKPDIGMQGIAVKKINNNEELSLYANQSKVDYLVQAFVPFENEVGIFYYRYPTEENGHISGIVGKEFLSVTGDGKQTIRDLLLKNKRFILQLPALQKMHGSALTNILGKDEEFLLVPYGNHARGAKFVDCSSWADAALTNTIDRICKQVPDFYFGRMDVRYNTLEELKKGINFSIIELNGAGSEPTHMYDPKHSLLFAWKEIIRHWLLLSRISRMNHHNKKIPYMKFSDGLKMFRDNKAYIKLIKE